MVAILLKYENKDLHNEFTGVSNLTKDNTTTTTNFRSYKIIYVWFINHEAIKLREMGVFRISIIHFKDNNSRIDHLLFVWFYADCVLCFSFVFFTFWWNGGLIDHEMLVINIELCRNCDNYNYQYREIIENYSYTTLLLCVIIYYVYLFSF